MKARTHVKTPFILQMENTDCGAVALGIVLAFYGCHVPIKELREKCGVSRDGVSVVNLVKAAQQYNFLTYTKKESPLLGQLDFPLILFWNRKHFVVLEGVKGKKIYINDPSRGRYTIDHTSFVKGFSGIVVELKPSQDFKQRAKEKQYRTYILAWLKNNWMSLTFLFASTCLLTLLNLAMPIFSQQFIDHYATFTTSKRFSPLLNMMVLALGVQISVIYAQRKIIRYLENESSEKMGASLIQKLVHLPASYFAQRKGGELAQSIHAVDRLAELISGPLCMGVMAAIQLVIYFSLMIYYSAVLSVIACVIALFNVGCFQFSKKYRHQLSSIAKQELVNLNSFTISCISMILQIKVLGQNHFFKQWQNQLNQYLRAQNRLSLANNIIQCISLFLVGVVNALILGMGGWLALNHFISIGELIAFNVLFLSFNEFVFQFVNFGSQLNLAQVDMQRTYDVLQYSAEQPRVQTAVPSTFYGKIEIIDLTFGYHCGANPLFNNLNLIIEPQTKVAITGPSGSGKSTLANLITGVYVPWSGTILIDNIPLATLSAEKRASFMTLSGQEQFFFKGSIKENLCLWEEYTDAELLQAMRIACIDELLKDNSEGLNFQLAEGATNLSGGQRQRLEIARSILRKPKIAIFDEATCALDSVVEDKIKQNVFKLKCTSLWIAHRLSTIRNADKIFILKEGKLVDSGSHQSLLNQKSRHYQELFKIDTQKIDLYV